MSVEMMPKEEESETRLCSLFKSPKSSALKLYCILLPSFLNLTDTSFLIVLVKFSRSLPEHESSSLRDSSLLSRYDLKRLNVSARSDRWFWLPVS